MTGDVTLRRQLAARLGGESGWIYDEPAVIEAACELAVRRLWATGYDVRDITATVTFMREVNLEAGKNPPGQLEMEAVIRAALGETDVDTSGIRPPAKMEIQGAVAGFAMRRLSLGQQEIDQLIDEAENITSRRGWNPPLID
jgi:hypothetical protein